jgi:PhnB protein
MQMNPYLSFKGDCEAAFDLYERCLGARREALFRYGGSPMAGDVPADWSEKVMHGTLKVGDQVLMAADVAPEHYEPPKGFSMSLHIESAADADRIFEQLADGGRVVTPIAKTFWAERFGMVVDRFGVPWLINAGNGEEVKS